MSKHKDLTEGLRQRLPRKNGKPHRDVKDARKVFDVVFRRALRQPDVVGVDVGYMVEESHQSFVDQIGIRFHVETKLSTKELESKGRTDLNNEKQVQSLFPSVKVEKTKGRITLDGVPIDIIEAQYSPFHLANNRIRSRRPQTPIETDDDSLGRSSGTRVEPLVGGVSIGTKDGPAGTLGLVVHDRTDGRPCILGNWHVLAGFDGSKYGRPCYQPAFFDGGTHEDHVGILKRWVLDAEADAALAQLDGQRDYSVGSILGLWFPVSAMIQPWLGQRVKKWGRSTGFTEGFVDGLYMATDIPYGPVTPRHFEGQIHLAPCYQGVAFSDLGDSGSVVVTDLVARYQGPGTTKRRRDDPINTARNVCGPPVHTLNDLRGHKKRQREWEQSRKKMRVYYAVGMLFAGDTAASRFGEFALAHPMIDLAEHLGFSIQPPLVPEGDMVPQLRSNMPGPLHGAIEGGGFPPQPVSFVAGRRSTIGGPQPTDPMPPDNGP